MLHKHIFHDSGKCKQHHDQIAFRISSNSDCSRRCHHDQNILIKVLLFFYVSYNVPEHCISQQNVGYKKEGEYHIPHDHFLLPEHDISPKCK